MLRVPMFTKSRDVMLYLSMNILNISSDSGMNMKLFRRPSFLDNFNYILKEFIWK